MTTPPVVGTNEQNNRKGLKIITAITSILAVCGIGFGIYGMIQSSQKDNQISDLKSQVEEASKTDTVAEVTEVVPTTNEDKEPSTTTENTTNSSKEDSSHYIYIAEWDTKIALPDSLRSVSYRYYTAPGHSSLAVSGVSCANDGQCQYAPEFADPSKNNFTLGAISRIPTSSSATIVGAQKVFTIGDYDYYYTHPQSVYSTDSAEAEWEKESVNLIKDTLTNVDNYSAI